MLDVQMSMGVWLVGLAAPTALMHGIAACGQKQPRPVVSAGTATCLVRINPGIRASTAVGSGARPGVPGGRREPPIGAHGHYKQRPLGVAPAGNRPAPQGTCCSIDRRHARPLPNGYSPRCCADLYIASCRCWCPAGALSRTTRGHGTAVSMHRSAYWQSLHALCIVLQQCNSHPGAISGAIRVNWKH